MRANLSARKDAMIAGLRSVEHVLAPQIARGLTQEPPECYAPFMAHQESGGDIDPVVKGLLTHLPLAGSVWPAVDRKLWLELLEGTFRMIYKETAAESPPASQANEPPS